MLKKRKIEGINEKKLDIENDLKEGIFTLIHPCLPRAGCRGCCLRENANTANTN